MSPLTRRKLIATGTAAGAALATLRVPVLAQDDDMPTILVGSTNYTEQFILAEMFNLMLQDSGYETEVQHNLGGTFVIHEARNNGDIDVHLEYTGQMLTILEQEVADLRDEDSTPEEVIEIVYDVVKQGYEENWNAITLDQLGFNNTFAFAMRGDHAEELGITTITDLTEHAGDLMLGGTQEFLIRDDGLPGIQEMYDFEFQDTQGMDSGLMYNALDNGDVDVISAFATDGRIPALDFVLLEDDLGFFPPYYAVPVVRGELLEQDPALEKVLNQLSGQIDDITMAELNYRVDDGGEEQRDVARDYLETEGIIGSGE